MSNQITLKSQSRCFGGTVAYYTHESQCCHSPMNFSVYLPPQAATQKLPVLYYLSGLTCTEENFTVKAGAQRYAAEHGLILVAPDTSPRQTGITGEDETWDIGSGAGFYVNATVEPWKNHYQMYDYIVEELPSLIVEIFPINIEKQSIFGHSMGGHGALICALKNPQKYSSVSAFAPIAAPTKCPWGQKAFKTYLGDNSSLYQAYDASELVKQHPLSFPILIDQGTADQFYEQKQLLPEIFQHACEESGQELKLRFQEGYDHSYFMIATFMADHIEFHAQFLNN